MYFQTPLWLSWQLHDCLEHRLFYYFKMLDYTYTLPNAIVDDTIPMEYDCWNMCEPFCFCCNASTAKVTECHISHKLVTIANLPLQTILLARFSNNKCSDLIILLL